MSHAIIPEQRRDDGDVGPPVAKARLGRLWYEQLVDASLERGRFLFASRPVALYVHHAVAGVSKDDTIRTGTS